MALFEITADSLIEVSQASFADLKIYTMNDHDRELAPMSPIEKPST